MEKLQLRISGLNVWVPGLKSQKEFLSWARGEKILSTETDKEELPDLSFIPAMQRRRMTPLSKLTTALIHNLQSLILPEGKIYFVSLAGEAARQLQINTMVLQDEEILPATFSTSVFNTPPAMASIILSLKNGYSALYPSAKDFSSALQCVLAPLMAQTRSQVLFVYADAQSPEEYQSLDGACDVTWGFATLLEASFEGDLEGKTIDVSDLLCSTIKTPQDFLIQLLQTEVSAPSLLDR